MIASGLLSGGMEIILNYNIFLMPKFFKEAVQNIEDNQ
jgi:hypothetical protein